MDELVSVEAERRRLERRTNPTLAELTLPELRRMMVTTILFVVIVVLFLFMVKSVIIAAILGVIVATAMRPVYLRLLAHLPNRVLSATITLAILVVPAGALTVYSYEEIADVATYVNAHQDEIANKIDASLHHLPFLGAANTSSAVKHYVVVASNYGTKVLGSLRDALATIAIGA